MRELEKPVARVFRRLRFQRFLAALVWSWALALAVVAATIGARSLLNLTIPGPDWAPFAVAGLVGLLDRGRAFRLPRARAGWTPRWRSIGYFI